MVKHGVSTLIRSLTIKKQGLALRQPPGNYLIQTTFASSIVHGLVPKVLSYYGGHTYFKAFWISRL